MYITPEPDRRSWRFQFLVLQSVGTLWVAGIVISPDVSSIWWGRIRFESWKWESKTSVSSVVTLREFHSRTLFPFYLSNEQIALPPFRQIIWKLLLSMSQTHISKPFWLSILRFSANKQSLRCMQSSRACLLFVPASHIWYSIREVGGVWCMIFVCNFAFVLHLLWLVSLISSDRDINMTFQN